jgi:hypothetical protein
MDMDMDESKYVYMDKKTPYLHSLEILQIFVGIFYT